MKEKEMRKLEYDIKEIETKLVKEQKLGFGLIQDLQALKPKLKELEKDNLALKQERDTLKV